MPETTTFKKPVPRIGVDMYTIFKVETDTPGTGTTYGAPVHIPGTVEIAPTDKGGVEVFDADNGAYVSVDYLESLGHELTNADIPPEVDALMRGLELEDGGVSVGKDTKAPYFAAAWRVTNADGSYRLFRAYKGKYSFASPVGGKTKPSTGAPENQTASATYSSVARDSDGKYYYYRDTDNLPEGVTVETAIEKWFSDPNWFPSDEASA